MERKDKNMSLQESSILLQVSNPILSLASDNPVLMPVAVAANEDMKDNSSSQATENKHGVSSKSSSTPPLISQLEQPLLVRKPPLNPISNVPQPPSRTQISANDHSLEHFYDVLPPLTNDIIAEQSFSADTYNVPQSAVQSNWKESQSIYPPVMPGSTSFEVTRSYTEPTFVKTTSNVMPGVYSDGRTGSVPSSPLDNSSAPIYSVIPHWLFKDTVESKEVWYGFSEIDNVNLEVSFQGGSPDIVPTDGGRYDVLVDERLKRSVYFKANDLEVRRSTWFFQTSSACRYLPYDEEIAKVLEKHYINCCISRQWQRRFNVPGIGSFAFENPEFMLQYKEDLELWPSLSDSKTSPIVVKRGLPDGFEILPSEHTNIDHLVFIVQGIGSFCDLRFRTVSQCVDGFRDIANKLISSHFKKEVEQRKIGRVEFLPVAWHSKLHTSEFGLDSRMKNITLPSIPKLRHFTNDTLLDILLYSTPTYCQSILDTVAFEVNKMHTVFLERNPGFNGKVFVSGHSLGSLILFDILANQLQAASKSLSTDLFNTFKDIQALLEHLDLKDHLRLVEDQEISIEELSQLKEEDLINRGLSEEVCKKLMNYFHPKNDVSESHNEPSRGDCEIVNQKDVVFPNGKPNNGMSLIDYPRLNFSPAGFFALGSPIAMFLAVRGYDRISEDFSFPTCPALFHIFHPYDPVAFRLEPLIDPEFCENPVLIPHHKGRKRLHREIRENVAKFAAEIKHKVTETMRFTWNSLNEFAKSYSFPNAVVAAEVDNLLELKTSESEETESLGIRTPKEDIKIGLLNGGRRIDYVLQEKPIEALNDYVFALTSHATYWDSEDTVLLILKEIYAIQGIIMASYQVDNSLLSAESSQNIHNVMNEQLVNIEPLGMNSTIYTDSTFETICSSSDNSSTAIPSYTANAPNLTETFPHSYPMHVTATTDSPIPYSISNNTISIEHATPSIPFVINTSGTIPPNSFNTSDAYTLNEPNFTPLSCETIFTPSSAYVSTAPGSTTSYSAIPSEHDIDSNQSAYNALNITYTVSGLGTVPTTATLVNTSSSTNFSSGPVLSSTATGSTVSSSKLFSGTLDTSSTCKEPSTTFPSVTNNGQTAVIDNSKPVTLAVAGSTESIGPPPLSGFVKRSPFIR